MHKHQTLPRGTRRFAWPGLHSLTLPALLSLLLLSACASGPDKRPPPNESASLRFLNFPASKAGQCPPAPAAACPPCPAAPASAACPASDTPSAASPAVPPPPAADPLQAASWEELPGWKTDDHLAAWPAFLSSCQALLTRPQSALWRPACDAAKGLAPTDASSVRQFFEAHLSPWRLVNPDGNADGLVTGYYEPLLNGARQRGGAYQHALLAPPPDLLTIDLSEVLPELKDRRLRGRLVGNKVVPYAARAEILRNESQQRPLLWIDDPIELFFLQIQGSGRVRLPSGELVRVGYADQNGHPYLSIGRVLLDRGDLKQGEASMQGIQAWARAHPARLDELLNSNPSYVFFRELPSKLGAHEGPYGALGVPLTAERSIAIDPRHVPLGAPVFLATTRPNTAQPLQRLMLAQDTGGAIKGVVRADFFWGFGATAGALAGKMKQSGQMWVLLPPGAGPRR